MSERTRVLVVADGASQAEELRRVLEAEGFEVALARDGEEGLDRCRTTAPDLVLADVVAPRMTGHDLCAAIKRDEATRATPVVLLTPLDEVADLTRGLECGADDFIARPVEAACLAARIRGVLARRGSRGARAGVEAGERRGLAPDPERVRDFLASTFDELSRAKLRGLEDRLVEERRRLQEQTHRFLTERERAEEELRARASQQEDVAAFGRRALANRDLDAVLADAVQLVSRTLGAELAEVLEVLPDGAGLKLRAGTGWREGSIGATTIAWTGSLAGFALLSRTPVLVEDLAAEKRFTPPPHLLDHGVVSGATVLIEVENGAWGTLAAHARRRRRFGPDDVHFLRSVAGVLATAVQRQQADQALRRIEEQFRQSQKMEAMGRLAGGVAHDFNNMLAAIIGYTDILMSGFAEGDPARSDLEQVRKAADRATGLTRQLLAFSRKQVLEAKIMDPNTVVADMDKMLRRLIGEHIDLATKLEPRVGSIRADPGQVEQVILNLVVNARDAMPKGGRIVIESRDAELDNGYARAAGVRPGRYVLLTVSDSGTGMTKEVLSHLFEPFFTTKDKGKGTGLGLSTVYGIVKQSEGHVAVYSEIGKGSTFKVYFPRIEEGTETQKIVTGFAPFGAGTETVLLAEDEEMLCDIVRRVLERSGYRVLVAHDGAEALALGERHVQPIHAMISDVVLPALSGPDLVQRLTARHPEMRVLFISGYPQGFANNHLVPGGVAFLQKPFKPEALLKKLRLLLDQAPAASA